MYAYASLAAGYEVVDGSDVIVAPTGTCVMSS